MKKGFSRSEYNLIKQEVSHHFEVLFGVLASQHMLEYLEKSEQEYRKSSPSMLFSDLKKIMSTMIGSGQAHKEIVAIEKKYGGWKP